MKICMKEQAQLYSLRMQVWVEGRTV